MHQNSHGRGKIELNMNLSAVIFDLDGTVLDNEDEYGLAFRKVLRRLGKSVDKRRPHISGIGVKENWPILLDKYKIHTKKTFEELAQETQEVCRSLLDRVKITPGFEKFVTGLAESNIATALATSNSWWMVDEIDDIFGITKYFDVVTTVEEVEYKKPDPEIFLLTAQKLGIEPKECLVIEDAQAGIDAARAAGMKVIGISKKWGNELKDADLVVKNFEEITLDILLTI